MMSVRDARPRPDGTYVFQSRSDPRKDYSTIITTEGRLQCDCKGWTIKKSGQPRRCTHTDQVALLAGSGWVRGTGDEEDYVYIREFDGTYNTDAVRRDVERTPMLPKPTRKPKVVEEARDRTRIGKTDIAPGVLRQRRIILD